MVTADTVIVASGCVGTTELMLRCKQANTIPGLSDRLGSSFSTNGDYLAFLPRTRVPVSLTRGPVTTSFAHFNTPEHRHDADVSKFHTIEDQGIPRALASVVGAGAPLLRSLSKGRSKPLWTAWTIFLYVLKRIREYLRALIVNRDERQLQLASEDELVMNMMCIAAMGRERSTGRFRLGQGGARRRSASSTEAKRAT